MCESSTQAREYNTPSTPRRAWIIHSWSSQSPLCLNPECQTSDSDFTAACVSRYRVLSSLTCAPMWQEKSTFSWLWTLVWEEKSSTPNLTKNVTMQNCFRPLACSWSELRDQISKTIVMVGLCASELTDGRLNLVSADCKQKQNKIVITDIQANQINEVFFYQCQINLDLWIARYVFFFLHFYGIWQFSDRWQL